MNKIIIKAYFIERLKERDTWLGIITALTSLGILLSPEQMNAWASIGTMIIGAILAGSKDPYTPKIDPKD